MALPPRIPEFLEGRSLGLRKSERVSHRVILVADGLLLATFAALGLLYGPVFLIMAAMMAAMFLLGWILFQRREREAALVFDQRGIESRVQGLIPWSAIERVRALRGFSKGYEVYWRPAPDQPLRRFLVSDRIQYWHDVDAVLDAVANPGRAAVAEPGVVRPAPTFRRR